MSQITVIVTFYNQAAWVGCALDSVLAQTHPDVQLIITDDASTDDTSIAISQWLVDHRHDLADRSMAHQVVTAASNIGLPAILNKALAQATGAAIAILNGDDWMAPDRIQRQHNALDSAPCAVGLVYSDIRLHSADGRPTGQVLPLPGTLTLNGQVLRRLITEESLIGMSMIMFRRSMLSEIGEFDTSLMADDFDFILRVAAANYEFRYIPGVVTNVRRYSSSMTGGDNLGALFQGQIVALRKLLGPDQTLNDVVYRRLENLAITLHGLDGHSREARIALWHVLRGRPSKRAARGLAECLLRLPARSLAPRRRVPNSV